MMDTIRLDIKPGGYAVRGSNYRLFGTSKASIERSDFGRTVHCKHGFKGYACSPKLSLVKKDDGVHLTVTVSVPKLIHGLNVYEVSENDYELFRNCLDEVLSSIDIFIFNLDDAEVERVDIAKNALLQHHHANEMVYKLSKISLNRSVKSFTYYDNKGLGVNYNKPSNKKPKMQFCIYDKIGDMRKYTGHQLGDDRQVTKSFVESLPQILRLEARLLNKKALYTALGKLGYSISKAPEFFDKRLWHDIINLYWTELSSDYNTGLLIGNETHIPYSMLRGSKQQVLINLLVSTNNSLTVDEYKKTLTHIFGKHTVKRLFDTATKELMKISKSNYLLNEIDNISKQIDDFEVINDELPTISKIITTIQQHD